MVKARKIFRFAENELPNLELSMRLLTCKLNCLNGFPDETVLNINSVPIDLYESN